MKRVIGGELAPEDKYHWAVSLKGDVEGIKKSVACGATIIKEKNKESSRWLITAAHCFYYRSIFKNMDFDKPKMWHARIGLRNVKFHYDKHGKTFWAKDKAKQLYRKLKDLFGKSYSVENDLHVKKIYIHPKYKPGILEYDVALLKLRHSIYPEKMKSVNSVDLPPTTVGNTWPRVNDSCIVVGWGCTKAGGSANPNAKLAKLRIWSNDECRAGFNNLKIGLNNENEFCAGYKDKKYGLCPGDSGSGLVCTHPDTGKYALAGVVSAAHSKTPGQYPAIFSRVSYYMPWIQKTMH